MVRKNVLYQIVGVAWFGLTFVALLVVITGIAEPYVSPAQFPGEHLGVVGGFIGLLLISVGVPGLVLRLSWKRAGRRAGLSPEGGGLLSGKPDFTGHVRGRPVQVWTYTRKSGSGGEGGYKRSQTYTVVETELTRPLDDGFKIQLKVDNPYSIKFNLFPGSTSPKPDDPEFEVIGGRSDAFSREVLSGRSREALDGLTYFWSFSVGDTRRVTVDAIPDSVSSLAGVRSFPDGHSGEGANMPEVASRVVHTTKGLLLDGNELERQIEAVVAVAEAVEAVEVEPRRA